MRKVMDNHMEDGIAINGLPQLEAGRCADEQENRELQCAYLDLHAMMQTSHPKQYQLGSG